jgi:hypothetical protein
MAESDLNYHGDPEAERMTYQISYAKDDWRGRLVLSILEKAIGDYLARTISNKLRNDAKDFLYNDNPLFEVAMAILNQDPDMFRKQLNKMRKLNLPFQKRYEFSGEQR